MLFAAFYAYLIPFGVIISFAALVLQFYMDRYLLFKRQSNPDPINHNLPIAMVDVFLEMIIVSYSAGCFVFEILLYQKLSVFTIIQLALTSLYWISPVEKLQRLFCQKIEIEYIEQADYQESKKQFKFEADYDRLNPITQNQAINEYIQFCIEHAEGKEKSAFQKIQRFKEKDPNNNLLIISSGEQQQKLESCCLRDYTRKKTLILNASQLEQLKKIKARRKLQGKIREVELINQVIKNTNPLTKVVPLNH